MIKPLIIGVTGGSGSGKSLFVQEIVKNFSAEQVCLVTQDNYYRKREEQPTDENGIKNFDLPESIDDEHFFRDIIALREGREVRLTEYTYNNPDVEPKELVFSPAPVLIVEGILVCYWEKLRSLIDLIVFIEAKDLIKVKRRIIRDAKERGYDLNDVLYRYEHHVAPFYERFVKPIKYDADLIIPNNTDFKMGLEVLTGFIRDYLASK
jgi:uridine kinase